MTDPSDNPNPGGRPPALDEQKRRNILAMLANGSSRRMAAAYAGCAPSTILRTLLRDPDFAAAAERAEQNTEIEALRRIRAASRNERYWRAAAWLLERRNPQDFAQRTPNAYTDQQLVQFFLNFMDPFIKSMSDQQYDEAIQRIDDIIRLIRDRPQEAATPPPPVAVAFNFENTDQTNGGSFAPYHPNDLCNDDEASLSQDYIVEAVQIIAVPPTETAA